jgi:hypothetical protein
MFLYLFPSGTLYPCFISALTANRLLHFLAFTAKDFTNTLKCKRLAKVEAADRGLRAFGRPYR